MNVPKKPTSGNDSASKPPCSNRGAQNTAHLKKAFKNRVSFDWIEFTLPYSFKWEAIKSYIKIPGAKFIKAERGLMGYPDQWIYGPVKVLTGATEEMGHHVIMGGESLRRMKRSLPDLIHFLLHQSAKFTRVDVACDDFTGLVTVDKVAENLKSGLATSSFRQFRVLESASISTGEEMGKTVYIGSPSSRIMIRVYDKFLELFYGKMKDFVGPMLPQCRVEIQMRKERAQQFINEWHVENKEVGGLAEAVLNKYVQFRTQSSDSNKSRWPLCSWWSDFLGTTAKLSLTLEKVFRTVHEIKKWFIRQVSPSFATLLNAYGEDEMLKVVKDGMARMTKQHWEMVHLAKI